MATTIKLKNGSGAPLASDLVQGEPAFDLTNKRLYTEDSGGTVIEIGTSPSTIDINAGTVDGISSLSTANGTDVSFAGVSATKFFWDASAESLSIPTLFTTVGINAAKTASTYNDVASFSSQAGTSKLRIDDNSNNSATTRMYITHNFSRSSGGFAADSLSVGVSQLSFDNGVVSVSTAEAGNNNPTERLRITSSGNVGIGTSSPAAKVHSQAGASQVALMAGGTVNDPLYPAFGFDGQVGSNGGRGAGMYLPADSTLAWSTAGSERMRIDSSGNLLVGTTSAVSKLTSSAGAADGTTGFGGSFHANTGAGGDAYVQLGGARSSGLASGAVAIINAKNSFGTGQLTFQTEGTERARIDSSGNLLVGTTSNSLYNTTTETGVQIDGANGNVAIARTSNKCLNLNRLSTDGDIVEFRKDGTTVGSIGTNSGFLTVNSGDIGLLFNSTDERIYATNGATGVKPNAVDLGDPTVPFKDLYLSATTWYGNGNQTVGMSGSDVLEINAAAGTGAITMRVAGDERARIDSSGALLVNTTSGGVGGGTLKVVNRANEDCFKAFQTQASYTAYFANVSSTSGYLAFWQYGGSGTVGSITTNGSSTSYNTTSDYRLKENVQDMVGATDRVMALKPCNFTWKSTGERVDGFLAHEAQEVVPEAVHGTKDGMRTEEYEVSPAVPAEYDEEGNVITEAVPAVMGTREVPDYQGIDQSKLVPLLTKALQEALTEIESLKSRVAALEA